MTVAASVVKNIIRKLLYGDDYRIEVVALIDAEFLQYVIGFFIRVAQAKIRNQTITTDWYKEEMLNLSLTKEEIAIHSGLNMKTIENMYNTQARHVVIEASLEHYDVLYQAIQNLVAQNDVNITLTIKFRGVSVDLDISESLIVINTIAVARAALRGGIWSTAGKQVEKPRFYANPELYGHPATRRVRNPTKAIKRGSLQEIERP